MSKKKGIAVAVVLLLVLLIGGMLAYFTDKDTATNTFTIGDDIEITLNEVWTPADGQNVHPGATITKKPSIHNDSETTPAYVFLEVIVPCYKVGTTYDNPLFNYTVNLTDWMLVSESAINQETKTITYVYAYKDGSNLKSLAAGASTSNLFESVNVAESLTAEQADTIVTPNIVINAYGIQTDNLGSKTPAQIFEIFD